VLPALVEDVFGRGYTLHKQVKICAISKKCHGTKQERSTGQDKSPPILLSPLLLLLLLFAVLGIRSVREDLSEKVFDFLFVLAVVGFELRALN
jgi:hypothetical protein